MAKNYVVNDDVNDDGDDEENEYFDVVDYSIMKDSNKKALAQFDNNCFSNGCS